MTSSIYKSGFAKLIVAMLFIGLICVWAAWPRRLPPPVEANRVFHPDGYSIILPPEWKRSIETEQAGLSRGNRGWLKIEPIKQGYYPPSLTINVLLDPPDEATLRQKNHFTDGTFHGLPALIASAPQKKYWSYRIIWKDRDRWFEVNLLKPDYEDLPNSSWWPYIDSIRYQPEKATATTSPTTAKPSFGATPQTQPTP